MDLIHGKLLKDNEEQHRHDQNELGVLIKLPELPTY